MTFATQAMLVVDRLLRRRNERCFGCVLMHDRLDHYDEKPLTLSEIEAAPKPLWVYCIDSEGVPPPLRSGHRYQVIGEVTKHIDGRPLDKSDERWVLTVGEAGEQEYRKSRFIPEAEFKEWRYTDLSRRLAAIRAELAALEEPDGRF